MKFVEIIPPEAGRLDEHKAVVELTTGDLELLRAAMPERGHGRSAAQLDLGVLLAKTWRELLLRRRLAGEDA